MIHGTQAIHPRIGTGNLTARFRRLGLLPLLFFILHANYYREVGGLPHMWIRAIETVST